MLTLSNLTLLHIFTNWHVRTNTICCYPLKHDSTYMVYHHGKYTNWWWYLIASLECCGWKYFLKFYSKVNKVKICSKLFHESRAIHLSYSNILQFNSNNPLVFVLVLIYFTLPAYMMWRYFLYYRFCRLMWDWEEKMNKSWNVHW